MSVATFLDILYSKGNSLLIGVGLPLQQETGIAHDAIDNARSFPLPIISPSLFIDSVGPTVVSLPSISPAHGSVVATFVAASIDFYTALPLLPSPPFLLCFNLSATSTAPRCKPPLHPPCCRCNLLYQELPFLPCFSLSCCRTPLLQPTAALAAESSSILPLPPYRERHRGHLFLAGTRCRRVGQDPTPDRR
ncbi:hypothetical protein BHM03_00016281 [Ensete ventricosum]|nr:hypothetical protein BHM03_00016281 [Ensete ventricosum]